MQADDLSSIDPDTDYTKILPIQQKRTIAFINHFVMTTVSFLNSFAQSCESRLMEFEFKLQKVEASLCILESQLSSIAGLEDSDSGIEKSLPAVVDTEEPIKDAEAPTEEVRSEVVVPEVAGIVASEDPRFQKFFKMVQFRVPVPAVKLQMQAENVDPNILDTPNAVIPGGPVVKDETDASL